MYVPSVVGVPENTPDALSVIPGGKPPDPVIVQAGVTTPLWPNDALYAIPVVPAGTNVVVITIPLASPMKNVRLAVWPAASPTETVKENIGPDPATVGVPVIAPVEAFRDNPGGNDPAREKLSGVKFPFPTPTAAL